ncbi:TetR/AcrR family transcriptional regulator [Amycolatopsis albispora]|uniref:TetR family transcriptional regulator n=1 Tax=Amycolatopsis albispora TaxID=1804986 RepID=A0A344L5S4_9PSEU|nr:TetR/AcrR family transcriptional regulator [Amycolatopsis albispora]AXB43398.1 TetR family transcriptional regulator [Amycolatopsis albispora]
MPASASSGRTDGRAARWAGQRERRRREFVEAALRAIREHGPDLSTERIAEEAGVARTRLYKHFTDATDIHRAIAARAVELINTELAPLWDLHGSPAQMISTAVDAHIRWLSENWHLYRYLSRLSLSGPDAVNDVKSTIGEHLTVLFEHYLAAFGLDTRVAAPAAFSVVGLVDASTAQWLKDTRGLEHAEFAGLLARWVWRIVDDTLRAGGVELDPGAPLAMPDLAFPSARPEPG